MPTYSTFPRSNVPGKIPDYLDPGSIGTNWADGKLFVGGPTGVAQLVGFPLRNFSQTSAYRKEDVVVHENRIWQCQIEFLSPGSFNPNNWVDLTEGSIDAVKELASSVLLTGGDLDLVGNTVTVTAGTGIQMNVADPDNPNPILFSWPERQASGTFPANSALIVSITGSGALQFNSTEAYGGALQRTTVRIGVITTDGLGNPVTAYPAQRAAYQTTDTLNDLIRAVGPFKRSGLDLELVGVSGFQVGAGEAFWAGAAWSQDQSDPNRLVIGSPITPNLRMASRVGYATGNIVASADVTQWDNAGVLQAVPAGSYTNQFVFLDPNFDLVVLYGQALYPTETAANDKLSEDWQNLVIPSIAQRLLVLGVMTTSGDASVQAVTSSAKKLGAPFGGGAGGGGGDLTNYLLIDGTRPMTGNLNLGGNGIVSGKVDGEQVVIQPKSSDVTGEMPADDNGELTVNIADNKIYLGDQLISQLIDVFDPGAAYKVGDLVIESDTLYQCEADIPPGVFDPTDWQAIGGSGGSTGDALVKEPDSPTRNQIDLTQAGGGATAISVEIDQTQSVNVADFGPRASINRFGVPTGSFGGAVFVVSQATHGYTRVGTPVYFNGLNWLLADDGAQSRFPNAVIAEIIDANSFTLQVAGRITSLNPAAFEGGVITGGTYYYAASTPGLLTATPGSTPVPVLYTTSTTTGIVKLTGTLIPKVITIPEIVDALYPVGSLYMSVDPANPATRWSGTTWVAHAAGRALVGVGSNGEGDFAVNQLRGSEEVTLSAAQMPTHQHLVDPPATNTNIAGAHTHTVLAYDVVTGAGARLGNTWDSAPGGRSSVIPSAGDHTHSVDIPEFSSGNAGSGEAHSNIQPSIGVYVWRRTA